MIKYLFLFMVFISHEVEARIHTVLTKENIKNIMTNHDDVIFVKHTKHFNHIKYNTKFSDIVSAAAQKHNIDENLIHAIIQTESSYNASAISPKGAVGAMQLMPDTATRFGVKDRTDPKQNINGGTKYLKYLFTLFDDIKLVVAAYNAGEGAVMKYNNKIPPYPETRDYVKSVMARL